MRSIDLKALADDQIVLRNPHKGWYHHYFDNGITKYLPNSDEELETFPGMDHLYLRLAWSYLEPQRGVFNWSIVDDVIQKWTAKGMGISFRISCKESHDCVFATPEWVKDLGAKGEFTPFLGHEPTTWRPDYADPIFLEQLGDFHKAFAERYDAQPWLRYVDIGSYGQWGEGHNYGCGDDVDDWPVEVLQEHVRLHQRHYHKATLVVPDEFAAQRKDGRGREFTQWLLNEGIGVRDDSIGVPFHVRRFPTDSLSHPWVWENAWRSKPTIIELQHYPKMRDPRGDNTWRGANGGELGAEYLLAAVRKMRATYIGYHGDATQWLGDNPLITNKLTNMVGYWFFLQSITLPETIQAGQPFSLQLTWMNRGVAPAYRRFDLGVRWRNLSSGQIVHSEPLANSDCTRWLPDTPASEASTVTAPAVLARYALELALTDRAGSPARAVQLALRGSMETKDGYYRLATIDVSPAR